MKKNGIVGVLAGLCFVSLLVMVCVLVSGGSAGAFTPPPFEELAQTGVPDHFGYQELDAGAFRVGLSGELQIREGKAEIWFANPEDNGVWLKLRILDAQGEILGQTGLLRPGEYVRQVAILDCSPGLPVVLKVMAYEPDTYHSAGAIELHTRIAVE